MGSINRLNLFLFNQAKSSSQIRFLYTVHHNVNRGLFYVKLEDKSRAVLKYIQNGKILDMQSINVPNQYKGLGLARLLAETAITYAVINDFLLYLTCDYMQKYYLAVKNFDLEERIIGPPHILDNTNFPDLDPDSIYKLPDPEDFDIK